MIEEIGDTEEIVLDRYPAHRPVSVDAVVGVAPIMVTVA